MEDEDPACDITGHCVALRSARKSGICNCVHCGKELHLEDGQWWTWDAIDRPPDERLPQSEDDA